MSFGRLNLALSLLLVFASGALVGALGHRYYNLKAVSAGPPKPRNPEEFRKRYMSEMTARLRLSPEQQKSLDTILDDTREQFRLVREKYHPEMKQIQDGQVERINAILSRDQQAEYAIYRKEREDKKRLEDEGKRGPKPH